MLLRTRSFVLALPLAAALAFASAGCSGTAGTEPIAASPEGATTRAPVAQNAHGPLKVMGDALGDVPLTASQRAAVESLATDAENRHAAARAAHKDLALAIAGQVQAGAIDRAALQPKIDAVVAAMKAAQPGDRAGLEQLHAILTPDQRTAFVDAVRARMSQHKGAGAMREHHGLKQWATDLGLSDEQRSQIKDGLKQHFQAKMAAGHEGAPWGEAKEHGHAVMEAFKGDRFVMNEVAPPHDVAQMSQKMTDHLLGIAEVALPILTPQQRTLAAQKLRDRAEAGDEAAPLP
ncbi:MAG TPA: Spy/CpxP family protein refolding chaperone [Polyangiaceae bacterium]|jgi:Spy/CpxP family protein refolding chaperone